MNSLFLRSTLFLISFFNYLYPTYAQGDLRPGFIVSPINDTIKVLVDYRESSVCYETCFYKSDSASRLMEASPKEINAYGYLGDKIYESREIASINKKKTKVFLEVLVSGRIKLLKYKNLFYVEKDTSGLVLIKGEKREVVIDDKIYVKSGLINVEKLKAMLADSPDLQKTKELKPGERFLTKLITEYNNFNAKAITYKSRKSWSKFSFGLNLGFNASKLNVRDLDHFKTFRNINLTPSLVTEISSPRVSERLSLHIELSYDKGNYLFYWEENFGNFISRNEGSIRMTAIKLPIGIKYVFKRKTFSPFIGLGAINCLALNSQIKRDTETEYTHSKRIDTWKGEWEPWLERKLYFGYYGGVGVSKNIKGKYNLYSQIRFENNFPYYLSNSIQHKINSFRIIIGFLF